MRDGSKMEPLEQRLENEPQEPEETSLLGRVADAYFEPKFWERWNNGLVYKCLGVHAFKKVVPTGGTYMNRIKGYHPISGTDDLEESLKRYEPRTKVIEKMHLFFGVIFAGFNVYGITNGLPLIDYPLAANLIINVYPLMLQRYNRALIYNKLDELEKKPKAEVV